MCTQVSKSTIEDWKKLRRLVSFKKVIVNDKKTIDAISSENMHTLINAAYGLYNDIRSQTGGEISLGWGVMHEKCIIQKLNTNISTEYEVVSFSDYLLYKI